MNTNAQEDDRKVLKPSNANSANLLTQLSRVLSDLIIRETTIYKNSEKSTIHFQEMRTFMEFPIA